MEKEITKTEPQTPIAFNEFVKAFRSGTFNCHAIGNHFTQESLNKFLKEQEKLMRKHKVVAINAAIYNEFK